MGKSPMLSKAEMREIARNDGMMYLRPMGCNTFLDSQGQTMAIVCSVYDYWFDELAAPRYMRKCEGARAERMKRYRKKRDKREARISLRRIPLAGGHRGSKSPSTPGIAQS